jgi:cytochrome b6-f complex iron-sulfur subunit
MEAEKHSTPVTRRSALTKVLLGWTALIVLPSLYVIARYLGPPMKRIIEATSVIAARINEMPLNSARIVKLGNKPLIVVHTVTGEYKAFSAICTHLGCVVEYRGDKGGYFHCNCHGGEYDLNGKNISGPPPRPLTPYSVSIKNQDIIVRAA